MVLVNSVHYKEGKTYVSPRLRHKAGYDAVLHADALGQELEQNGVISHSQRIGIRKGSLEYSGARLGVLEYPRKR